MSEGVKQEVGSASQYSHTISELGKQLQIINSGLSSIPEIPNNRHIVKTEITETSMMKMQKLKLFDTAQNEIQGGKKFEYVDQARKITLQDEPTCNARLLDSQNPLYPIQDDPKSRPTTNRISHQNHSRNPLLPTDNSKDTVFNDTSSFTYKDPNLNLKTEESVDVNLLGGFEIKSIEEMISKRGLHHDQKSLLENTDYGIKLKDLKSNSKSFCGTQTARLPTQEMSGTARLQKMLNEQSSTEQSEGKFLMLDSNMQVPTLGVTQLKGNGDQEILLNNESVEQLQLQITYSQKIGNNYLAKEDSGYS